MNVAAGARGPLPAGDGPRAFGLWLAAACGIGAAAALGLPLVASGAPPAGLLAALPNAQPAVPPASLGPGFALTAPDGTPVSDQSLRGAPYVLMFGYTRCGAPCDARLARVLALRARIGGAGAGGASAGGAGGAAASELRTQTLPVVFVSVDPEHDTPARMAAFAARAGGSVLALTGSAPAVARAASAFNTVYFKAALCGGGTIISHSNVAYLVGPDARPQAIITPDESDASALAKLRVLHPLQVNFDQV